MAATASSSIASSTSRYTAEVLQACAEMQQDELTALEVRSLDFMLSACQATRASGKARMLTNE